MSPEQITPQLFVTDLDGTFLDPAGAVTETNLQAVRHAGEAGIATVIATGRPLRILTAIESLRELNPLLISCNGAIVKRLADEELLHVHELETALAMAVATELREEIGERVNFAVEYPTGWAREPGYLPNPKFADADQITDVNDALASDQPVVKLLVQTKGLPTNVLDEIATPIANERLTTTYSSITDDGLLEIGAPGISKASALRQLLVDLAIPAEAVAAFGDMPNDLEMLQLVGMPYRMADCHHALEVCGFPCAGSNAESGVGHTMLRLLAGEGYGEQAKSPR